MQALAARGPSHPPTKVGIATRCRIQLRHWSETAMQPYAGGAEGRTMWALVVVSLHWHVEDSRKQLRCWGVVERTAGQDLPRLCCR